MVDHPATAESLLGTHVAQRAQEDARDGQVRIGFDAGQSEVGHPQAARLINHQIRRLNVTVDDPPLVSVVERLGRLDPDASDPLQIGEIAGCVGGEPIRCLR